MAETIINCKPAYITDDAGNRLTFWYDPAGERVFADRAGTPLPPIPP